MGDLFGAGVPEKWIRKVLAWTRGSPATFFFETKNPARYYEFLDEFPPNAILSTTIESNRDYGLSRAPPPEARYEAMTTLPWPRKHVSIEPVVDFDPGPLLGWLRDIEPEMVSVGYDNWNSGLPEPPLEKTLSLIRTLEDFTRVERKTLRKRRSKHE